MPSPCIGRSRRVTISRWWRTFLLRSKDPAQRISTTRNSPQGSSTGTSSWTCRAWSPTWKAASPGDWQGADRELAAKVVEHLIHLIATVSPGAKLGSTAPYSYANLMLVEAGSRQPRSLANAFREPVEKPQVGEAAEALSGHLSKLDAAYGARESRRIMSLDDCDVPNAERLNCDDLANWAADAVRNAKAA